MHSSQLSRRISQNIFASLRIAAISLTLLSCITLTAAQGSASDYYVRDLPGAPDGPLLRMHAGHIQVSEEHHGSLFFWHYQNRHIEGRQRTVIWLNGGPGCSSMDGNLMEVGPYRVLEGGRLAYNNGSWDQYSNLLFVDSPVGTGFSFVDTDSYLHELPEVATQFVTFLQHFFKIFPEYENDDLYIAGESYAGQYIPYIAQAILDRNNDASSHWNLKGLLIGNGWISAEHQSPANLEFAYVSGLVQPGSKAASRIEDQNRACQNRLGDGGKDHVDNPDCEGVLQTILQETRNLDAPDNEQCVNMYDIKLRDNYPSCGMNWPPDLETVTPYLRDPKVIQALHIDPSKKAQGWTECNGHVSSEFTARKSKPSYELLPGLLEKVPIVLFSGADDMICNHVGTEHLIGNLTWNGGTGFPQDEEIHEWTFDGVNAGTYRHARNLTYLLFYNSSHMVPFDYPERSRDMLDRFVGLDPSKRFPGSVVHGEDKELSQSPSQPETPPSAPVNSPIDPSFGNSTAEAEEEEEAARLEQARWDAYYRSGEVALVFVIILAGFWGWYVLRDRRRRAGYRGVKGGSTADAVIDGARDTFNGSVRMEAFRHKKEADLEEGEQTNGRVNGGVSEEQARRYSLGSAGSESSLDEDDLANRRAHR